MNKLTFEQRYQFIQNLSENQSWIRATQTIKLCSTMSLILLMNKISSFGVNRMHSRPNRLHYIQENALFWCGFITGCIIEPYFLKIEARARVTVNEDHNRTMIIYFLFKYMDDIDAGEMCFQEAEVTCHTTTVTIVLHMRNKIQTDTFAVIKNCNQLLKNHS